MLLYTVGLMPKCTNCTYTHIHTYSYTHIHIYTYTHIHIYAYTHIHIYTYAHKMKMNALSSFYYLSCTFTLTIATTFYLVLRILYPADIDDAERLSPLKQPYE